MFESTAMLFLTAETPLHAGSGSSLGIVDLPIQRERTTHYPMVQASGVKGALRAELARIAGKGDAVVGNVDPKIVTVFGPDTGNAAKHAGALAMGDARLLLFPVRSLRGVYAWITSHGVLVRFARDLEAAGIKHTWSPPVSMFEDQALTTPSTIVATADDRLLLEEFAFTTMVDARVAELAAWLAGNALPGSPEYGPWRTWLPQRLVVLHDDAYRDFTVFSTEVVSRIKLNPKTKAVARGALWTEEYLPTDAVLYAPAYASAARAEQPPSGLSSADGILAYLQGNLPSRFQLGGDETTGRGLVATRMLLAPVPQTAAPQGSVGDDEGESDA